MTFNNQVFVILISLAIAAQALSDDAPADALAAVDHASAEIIDLAPIYSGGLAKDFTKSVRWPWIGVPRGRRTFANVPLDIGGRICLWGERNAAINGQNFPERAEGIAVDRTIDTLYVYHCTFFQEANGTPVYELVFRYADGTSAVDEMKYGLDVKDWYGNRAEESFGPTGDRSVLAWQSDAIILQGMDGQRIQPLRFFLTAVTNPNPDRKVKTIDLVSTKSQAAGCILAMTAGSARLLRPREDR